MCGMTDAAVEAQLAPLPLTEAQLAAIRALNPAVFEQITGQPAEAPQRPERVIVRPGKESRLEALLALYRPYKDEAAAAKQKFDDLKASISAELEAAFEGDARPSDAYEIPASAMWPQITFQRKSQPYLPTAKIREFLPDVYKAFAGVKEYWEMRESTRGQRRGR